MATVGGVASALATITLMLAEVVALPAASRALALSVWAPLGTVVVFQDTEYGATRSSAPRLAPSSLNCTPTTPTLSAAAAETVTVFETVAPASGALIETVGGVVSEAADTRHPTQLFAGTECSSLMVPMKPAGSLGGLACQPVHVDFILR